jgi:hypothetical protein
MPLITAPAVTKGSDGRRSHPSRANRMMSTAMHQPACAASGSRRRRMPALGQSEPGAGCDRGATRARSKLGLGSRSNRQAASERRSWPSTTVWIRRARARCCGGKVCIRRCPRRGATGRSPASGVIRRPVRSARSPAWYASSPGPRRGSPGLPMVWCRRRRRWSSEAMPGVLRVSGGHVTQVLVGITAGYADPQLTAQDVCGQLAVIRACQRSPCPAPPRGFARERSAV